MGSLLNIELPSLHEMEVVPVSVGRLPSYLDLIEWKQGLKEFIYQQLDNLPYDKKHKCEKCNGYGHPNKDYTPTESEKLDPIVFVACPYNGFRYQYVPKYINPSRKNVVRYHIKSMKQSQWDDLSDKGEAWVFYTTTFHACGWCEDWAALDAITQMASPEPSERGIIKQWLFHTENFEAESVSNSVLEGDFKHVSYYLGSVEKAKEVFAQINAVQEAYHSGQLDDFAHSMRNPSFGDFPWSLSINNRFETAHAAAKKQVGELVGAYKI